jgi:hypothetical protein
MRSLRRRVAVLAGAGILGAITLAACDRSAYASDIAGPRPPAIDKPTCIYPHPF